MRRCFNKKFIKILESSIQRKMKCQKKPESKSLASLSFHMLFLTFISILLVVTILPWVINVDPGYFLLLKLFPNHELHILSSIFRSITYLVLLTHSLYACLLYTSDAADDLTR